MSYADLENDYLREQLKEVRNIVRDPGMFPDEKILALRKALGMDRPVIRELKNTKINYKSHVR